MEQIVNLDNARMLDNYRKILDEKKKGDEKTLSELRNSARRRVLDGASIKSMSDVSILLKFLAPIRYTYTDVYEQEKTILIPLLLGTLNITDSPKSRSDLVNELTKIEIELAKEVSPILGIDESAFPVIDQFINRYALDFDNARLIDLETGKGMGVEGFKLLHADKKIQEGKKEITMPEYLLKHSLLRCVEGYTNDPQLPIPLVISSNPMKTTYTYNNWKGFKSEVTEALPFDSPDKHCQCILNHIFNYAVNQNKAQYETLLGWMAHMVQRPWEKPGWAVLFGGREGCGKDVIARTLGKMLHPSHWIEIGHNEFVLPKETGWREGRLLTNITEFSGLTERNKPHVYQIIESPEARIRDLYRSAFTTKDISRCILTTNKPNSVEAKLDTRRFYIPDFNDEMGVNHEDSQAKKDYKHSYFVNLYNEIGGRSTLTIGEGIIAFYQYLKSYDISKFDITKPNLETQSIDEMIETNENCLDIVINDLMYRGEIPDYGEISIMPPIKFNLYTENVIEGSIINNNYKILFNRTIKEGGVSYPPIGTFSRHFIKALGLPWESSERRNNRQHYKIMKNNSLHYVLPSLTELRNKYFKMHPHKERPPG